MSASPAAANAIRILNVLAQHVEPQCAASLTHELGLPRSTIYRLLTTLTEFAYVSHEQESGRYCLGTGAYELAWAYQRQEPLRRIALPVVAALVDECKQTVHFGLLSGKNVVYVIEERGLYHPSLVTEAGVRLPAELTATGRAMLAQFSNVQISALYPSAAVLADRNKNGPRTITELRKILQDTRQRGWAEEVDSVTNGWSSLSVAVVDHAKFPVGAITITFASDSASRADRARYLRLLQQASNRIAARLS